MPSRDEGDLFPLNFAAFGTECYLAIHQGLLPSLGGTRACLRRARRGQLSSQYLGRFTEFGKSTSVRGARVAMLLHIFGLAAAEL
jgi:hypothetical protein